ncbi:MAG TPA: hypothetical protein VMM18_09220 [Gemmatimonadaceae bacterium]|nr:hypothetical protein [Gemmatimonadaceae bacterium]
MIAWVVAAAGGIALAALLYGWREPPPRQRFAFVAALRAIAITVLLALLLDAPVGRARPPAPVVALDASASWLRTEPVLWDSARARVRALDPDSVLLTGDSARSSAVPERPTDLLSVVRGAVDRALAAGRPLVLVTDGEIDDPQSLEALPGGSRVQVISRPPRSDVAVRLIDAPQAAVAGDTIEARVTLAAGSAGGVPGRLALTAGDRTGFETSFDSLLPFGEREIVARLALPAVDGSTVVRAIVEMPGDAEPRNDTLAVVVDVSRAAGAVYVSSAPDQDARFAIAVLRGAVVLPTRAFYRVAAGQWRREGTLAPVAEAEVRAALRDAPVAIIHGDTAVFGPPRAATRGSLALHAPPAPRGEDWYASTAPPSPLSGVLAAVPWDSLPPIDVAADGPRGDWIGLEATRARRLDSRPVIAGVERPRRVVVITGSGFWRWRFRGGESADAYTALWGGIFDWLAADRRDPRAVVPERGVLRAGDPIRWRRGVETDTLVTVVLRRLDAAGADTLTLLFAGDANVAETPPLAPGVYEANAAGARTVVAVNQSREWLPRQPTVRAGEVGRGAPPGAAPALRSRWWAYALVLLVLCVEWVARRRLGLR